MKRLAIALLLLLPPAWAQGSGYRISGIVLDAVSGSPVDGVEINLAPAAQPGQPQQFTTGDDGRFAFNGVAAGKYRLSAERRGYPRQFFQQHEAFSTAIVTGPDLDSGNIVFRLQPECVISGHVIDEHNEPVGQAQVVLLRAGVVDGEEGVQRVAQRSTDDLGRFHFPHLAPGIYYVAVSARPWYAMSAVGMIRSQRGSLTPEQERERSALNVAYPLTYYPSADAFTDADPIKLQPGDHVVADVGLHAVPALTLRIVRLPGGDDRPQVSLSAVLPDGSPMGFSSGSFQARSGDVEVTGVAPGHYSLTTFARSGRRGRSVTSQQEVDLSSSAEIAAPLAGAAPAISGKMEFGAVSCAQCRLMLTSTASHRHYVAQVSPGGDFTFADNLPAGTYDLTVSGAPDVYISSLLASGATVRGQQLTIAAADGVSLAVAIANGVGRVEGVARKDGKPVPGALLLLLPDNWQRNPALVRRDQSDSDGSFSLASVVPGKYLLLAIENGWELEWQRAEVLQPFLKNAERVQVVAGGSYQVAATAQPVARK